MSNKQENKYSTEYICDFPGCQKYLKEPITLPCGDMICKEHLDEQLERFKCPSCNEECLVPDGGFRINWRMNDLLNKNSHLTGKHKKTKDLFDLYEKRVKEFQRSSLADPQVYIHDYFAGITRKIYIHRELMIQSINERADEFLNTLNRLEHECKANESVNEIIQLSQSKSEELNKLSEKLRTLNITDQDLDEIKRKMKKALKEMEKRLGTIQKSLLMNKSVKFVAEGSREFGRLTVTNHANNHLEITNESGRLTQTFRGHSLWVTCIEQIEHFNKIATCSDDKTIKIWSTESGECLKTLTGHQGPITCLTVSNDKKHLISGSFDKSIKVWNIENDFECEQTLKQEFSILRLCLLPNNILVCGSINGLIAKWNMNDFTRLGLFKAHSSYIFDLKHVSSSQIVSCSEDKMIKLWNIETNQCLHEFKGHIDQVKCLEISADKSKLYSGSFDQTVIVWDISSGELIETIFLKYPIHSLKLLSTEILVAGLRSTRENLSIINLNNYEIVRSVLIETYEQSNAFIALTLNFNKEDNVLFVGSENGTIRKCQF
jgi:WD40 repeat protein